MDKVFLTEEKNRDEMSMKIMKVIWEKKKSRKAERIKRKRERDSW